MASNLDDILNDALNDFDFEDNTKATIKPSSTSAASSSSKPAEASSSAKKEESKPTTSALPSMPTLDNEADASKWAEEFFEKLKSEDPEMKRMMEEMTAAMGSMGTGSDQATSSSSSSVPLPNMPDIDMESPEFRGKLEQLQKMLAEVEGGSESDELLDKILEASGMSNMMQELMSKDVLLEPFQDMDKQYDAWLGSNGATCTPEDLNRFKQQHELVKKIIAAYQSSDDSTDVVAGLISEMQTFGDPPQGMLQGMLPDLKFGEDGKPIM